MILFILIEVLPIIVKLMSKYGPYDAIVDTKEAAAFYRQEARLLDIQDRIQTDRKNNQSINDRVRNLLNNEFVRVSRTRLKRKGVYQRNQ